MTDWVEEHQKDVDKYQTKINEVENQLNDPETSKRKMSKLEKEREKLIKKRDHSQYLKDRILTGEIEDSKWMKASNKLESAGNKMQSTGKKMTKAGLHTTGAVWSPLIYAGYQGVKHARNKPKNETPEQDLIELIKEVETAHKDGKIDEEQKRSYVLDFVDNYYRK